MNTEYKGEITGMTDENMMEKVVTEAQKKEFGAKAKVIIIGTEDFFGPGLFHLLQHILLRLHTHLCI